VAIRQLINIALKALISIETILIFHLTFFLVSPSVCDIHR